MANIKKNKEPLIHIAKRDDLSTGKAWLIRLAAIALGLLLSGIISSLLTGAFGRLLQGKTTLLWRFLQRTAILLCLALAVTPAFRMRFWNCGAEGQALMGGLAAIICMMKIGNSVPYVVLLVIVILASILAGGIWGMIPALFHAKYKTNETLFTLFRNITAFSYGRMQSLPSVSWYRYHQKQFPAVHRRPFS